MVGYRQFEFGIRKAGISVQSVLHPHSVFLRGRPSRQTAHFRYFRICSVSDSLDAEPFEPIVGRSKVRVHRRT